MNQIIDTILARRSVRDFSGRQIEDKDIEMILKCALNAPSACNMQSWHFTVIQNPDMIVYLNDTALINMAKSDNEFFRSFGENCPDLIYGAPTLILVSGCRECINPLTDCAAAAQNMLICAQSLGLATLWNGFIRFAFETKEARQKAKIPEGYDTYYGIAVGYAKEGFIPMDKEIIRDGVVDYIK